MRHFPLVACFALALAACQGTATVAVAPNTSQTATASSAPGSEAPSTAPTDTPTPTPIASPTATPAPLVFVSPSPLASPSPVPSGSATPTGSPSPLAEANHGTAPFPTAPGSSTEAIDLSQAVASATTGNDTAFGAIDGRLYTEWAARQAAGDKVALMLDLQAPRTFSRLDVLADASPAVNCFFNVDVSADGTTWTTVASGSAQGSNTMPQWGTATFTSQTTRYVRIKPTSWGTSWVGIWELRLRQ